MAQPTYCYYDNIYQVRFLIYKLFLINISYFIKDFKGVRRKKYCLKVFYLDRNWNKLMLSPVYCYTKLFKLLDNNRFFYAMVFIKYKYINTFFFVIAC